ncbi:MULTISPECIES: DUF4382 domain-containing protein [Halolamina]|uniref:DUF4382 domain-containing protein n=1 Tax=Halolamina pelagica TaxID=699431 RepID=A0A1I5VE34_9EURY|nr:MULTISPECIES: DUF4382 domain-containing protein [Halolamina]NHX37676.1 DUF4382 domain-containing protein [Halolamina sp. R1-12]SFQ05828.1 protein of unknown function [Halolamina pelagica]
MHDTTTSRRTYLRAAGAVGLAGITALAGCSGSTATGTLATKVKDAPGDIDDFETCVVTIQGFWVKESDGTETEESTDESTETAEGTEEVEQQDEEDVDRSDERTYYEYDEAQEADLVQLQDGETALVDERELETDTYAYLQLDVSGVDATLSDGSDADVGTPGEAPLQFKEQFEIRENQRTTFTADFTPVKRGQTGSYLLQPVASGTEVSYSDVTSTEGTATPTPSE